MGAASQRSCTTPSACQPSLPLPSAPAQVIQLAFLVACLYTGIGVLRLGWIIQFLSHSVITGFTSGAAMIIALSQARRARSPKGGARTPRAVWPQARCDVLQPAHFLAVKPLQTDAPPLSWSLHCTPTPPPGHPAAPQVKYLLGYSVPRADTLHESLHVLLADIHKFRWQVGRARARM